MRYNIRREQIPIIAEDAEALQLHAVFRAADRLKNREGDNYG